jgi:hypothetical protein
MIFTKEDLKKSVEQIMPKGYTIKQYFGAIQFLKRESQRDLRMGISYNEYPGSYYPKGMGAYIRFNDVEDILNKVLDKYKIQQRYGNETIRSVLFNLEGVDYSKFEAEIHDDESFQIVAEEIKKIVKYGAMPFFERYQTLEEVLVDMEKMEGREMANFITQPLPIRRMIIKKLCKDKDYEQYAMSIINYCKNKDITKSPTALLVEKVYRELEKY